MCMYIVHQMHIICVCVYVQSYKLHTFSLPGVRELTGDVGSEEEATDLLGF